MRRWGGCGRFRDARLIANCLEAILSRLITITERSNMRKSRKRRQQLIHQKEEHSKKDPAKYFWGLEPKWVFALAIIIGVGISFWLGWAEISDMDRNGP